MRKEFSNELKEVSMVFAFRHFLEHISVISADLASGRSYNIDPNVVRQPEDVAAEIGIRSSGGGLAATLNAAQNATLQRANETFPYFIFARGSRYSRRVLDDLSKFARLVNSEVLGIEVENDHIENKLRVFLRLSYDAGEIRLPLGLASDGTVKWLALVAAVLTNQSVVAIEEPENYMHPVMQREFVEIIRASCQKSTIPTFAIITTHSETLINAVVPDEMIIFSMDSGMTRALRPTNASELRSEIARTGFGLGYYYLAGALE